MEKEEKKSKYRLIEILLITSTLLVSLDIQSSPFSRNILGSFLVASIVYYTLIELELEGIGQRIAAWMLSFLFTILLIFQFARVGDSTGFYQLWVLISVVWVLTYASLGPRKDLEKLRDYSENQAQEIDNSVAEWKTDLASSSLEGKVREVIVAMPDIYAKYAGWLIIIVTIAYSVSIITSTGNTVALPIIWSMAILAITVLSGFETLAEKYK